VSRLKAVSTPYAIRHRKELPTSGSGSFTLGSIRRKFSSDRPQHAGPFRHSRAADLHLERDEVKRGSHGTWTFLFQADVRH